MLGQNATKVVLNIATSVLPFQPSSFPTGREAVIRQSGARQGYNSMSQSPAVSPPLSESADKVFVCFSGNNRGAISYSLLQFGVVGDGSILSCLMM